MNCEKCKFSYVDTTGVGVHLRCYLKNKTTPDCESFEEEKNVKDSKDDNESVLRLVFEKRLDVSQFLKSSCANGYNCYIRATYNWDKKLYEKFTLTDEEYERIKKTFDAFKGEKR